MDLGWYCRTINQQNNDNPDSSEEEASEDDVDYHLQYHELKKKLKFLLYENEFFQDSLKSSQRRLLKTTRDRSFLLDRLLQYEKPEETSESEDTDSEEDLEEVVAPKTEGKKRKAETLSNGNPNSHQKQSNPAKKKKQAPPKKMANTMVIKQEHSMDNEMMTAEEVERHLSRQSLIQLVPERASAQVPNEMFSISNEPSMDSEDQIVETSPE